MMYLADWLVYLSVFCMPSLFLSLSHTQCGHMGARTPSHTPTHPILKSLCTKLFGKPPYSNHYITSGSPVWFSDLCGVLIAGKRLELLSDSTQIFYRRRFLHDFMRHKCGRVLPLHRQTQWCPLLCTNLLSLISVVLSSHLICISESSS